MFFVFIAAAIAILTFILACLPEIEAWRADRYWARQMGRKR